MKHLRITATIDPDLVPPFFETLAGSDAIRETRAIDWSLAAEDVVTLLYEIDGDVAALSEHRENDGVESMAVTAADEPTSYALVSFRSAASPLTSAIACALSRSGLLVRKPVVYRDMTVQGSVVGDPGPLQSVLENAPQAFDVRVEEIGTYRGGPGLQSASLSERQREVVATALERGYYDRPRQVTHEELAAALDCAPATVSEHLQKAEAAVIEAAMGAPARRV